MAGTRSMLSRTKSDNGQFLEEIECTVTLAGGTQTIRLPDDAGGGAWRVKSTAVIAPGAGARGNLVATIAGDDLTVTSDAATEVSTVRVTLFRGGGPSIAA